MLTIFEKKYVFKTNILFLLDMCQKNHGILSYKLNSYRISDTTTWNHDRGAAFDTKLSYYPFLTAHV